MLLAGCASKPQAPDWQVDAHGALQRYEQAFLAGDTRVADAEFARARRDLAATGQPSLVARAELTRCAVQVASLVLDECTGFEPLRADAGPAERAYADYLQGAAVDAALLPAQHRVAAGGRASAAALAQIADPVSRLVAAGVVLRSGHADPQVLQVAADTASAQGWRRPLLAWLGAQLKLAEQRGAADGGRAPAPPHRPGGWCRLVSGGRRTASLGAAGRCGAEGDRVAQRRVGDTLCCHSQRAGPRSRYTDLGATTSFSTPARRGSRGGYGRNRRVASASREMPTTSSKSGTSRCQPSGVPGRYSATSACVNASGAMPSQRAALARSGSSHGGIGSAASRRCLLKSYLPP